jgi:hypothetical protein
MNAFLFTMIIGQGTDGRPVHPGRKPSQAATADGKPVTAKEVRESFVRAGELIKKVGQRSSGAPAIAANNRPATRSEVVAEMARIYKAAEPGFRFTPVSVPFDPSKFKIDATQKPALSMLVTRGFVARIGPLAVGPQPGLTTKEFGDALGFFLARLSQLSHLPSSKWTPMLQGG